MKEKIIYWLKNALLLNILIFLILAPYSKQAIKASLVIALLLWLIIAILEFRSELHKKLIAKTPVAKQLVFFGFALLLSTIFSVDPYYSHAVLLERFLGYIVFFCFGSYLVKFKHYLSVLIGAVIFAGFFMGVGGMWDYFHIEMLRLHTSFGYIVSHARFLILYIPLCFIMSLYSKNKILKIGAIISIILLFPCLLFNAARAAWVAIAVSLVIISFFNNRKISFFVLIFIMIVIAVSVFFLPAQLKHRALTTINPLTWGERVPLWKIAIRMFNDHPIFGVGLGMNEKLFSSYWKPSVLFPNFRYWHVHNNYLEIAAETGIVGLLSFLSVFGVFLKSAYSRLKLLKDDECIVFLGLTSSIIAALVFACSASNITSGIQEVTMFWFLFGMASGLIGAKENKVNTV